MRYYYARLPFIEKYSINFRFQFCLQVHDSRCALVLFTDFTLKLCNSYVVIAVNVLSLNLKTLYIVVSIFYKRLFIRTSFLIEKWKRVFIMWNAYEIMRHSLTCNPAKRFKKSHLSTYSTNNKNKTMLLNLIYYIVQPG